MTFTRRRFLSSSATLMAGSLAAQGLRGGDKPPFRTITYNVLACRGYPRTDANKGYLQRAAPRMADRFAMELELYDPDVVTFQESPKPELVAAIAKSMGYQHCHFPGGYPGTVLTKHKIVSHRNCPLLEGERPPDLFTRHWGRAVLLVRGEEIVLYSAHLHPSKADIREREVTAMLAVMKADIASGKSLLFQGDLNHDPNQPEYKRWLAAGWIDTFASKGKGDGMTISSTEQRKRIDYVLAHGPIAERLEECRALFEGPFRTNPEDPRSFALSDHIPVMATFSGA